MGHTSIHMVSIIPTLRCNLRCKLCGAYAPYYESTYHPTIDQYNKYVDRLFEIVQRVSVITVSGGESFMRSDIHELLDHIFTYEDRFDTLDLVTNGTIIPSEHLIGSLSKFGKKLRALVDDYGPGLSVNAKKVIDKLGTINGATVVYRDYYTENMHCNGWVDFGILSNKEKKSQTQAYDSFCKCAYVAKMQLCVNLVGGILYPCSAALAAVQLGIVQANDDDVIDLFDKSYTDDEIRERLAAWYTRRHAFSACAYCNGLCEDSERFTPAEQLPKATACKET